VRGSSVGLIRMTSLFRLGPVEYVAENLGSMSLQVAAPAPPAARQEGPGDEEGDHKADDHKGPHSAILLQTVVFIPDGEIGQTVPRTALKGALPTVSKAAPCGRELVRELRHPPRRP